MAAGVVAVVWYLAGASTLHVLLPEVPAPAPEFVADAATVLAEAARLEPAEMKVRVVSTVEDARATLAEDPALALTSVPLLLELLRDDRELRLHLVPTRAGSNGQGYAILVPGSSAVKGLAELTSLTGTMLYDADFARPWLGGPADLVLVPSARPLAAVRMVRRGEVDGLLASESEREALEGLLSEGELRAVGAPPSLPLPPLIGLGEPSEEDLRVVTALAGLCADADGALLCEAFGIDGWTRGSLDVYKSLLGPDPAPSPVPEGD